MSVTDPIPRPRSANEREGYTSDTANEELALPNHVVQAPVTTQDVDKEAVLSGGVAVGRTLTAGTMDDDMPKNSMWLVMPALGLVAFVSALDQTIIATALPTISRELGATPSQYSWVGTSYLLCQTIITPLNGRLTDVIGRKPALYASIITLLVFSALCGAAQNITWLIIARAFSGIGGGSIVGLTTIVISDIVPLHKVGEYQGNLGIAYAFASVLGPLLGGIFTDQVSWRWCFLCGLSLVLLFFCLKLKPAPSTTLAEVRRTFDFLGLTLIIAASALLIIGFANAADHGFGVPSAYAVIVAGAVVFAAAIVHCLVTKRNAIIPRRLLTTRTPLFFVLGSHLQSLIFVAAGFILPQYFQGVRGATALSAGLQLLPFALCSALFGLVAGQITSRLRIVRPLIWGGYATAGLAYALIYACFSPTTSLATQSGLLVLLGAGIGFALMPPILMIQAALPRADMAAATSTWVLMRSIAAAVGLAVFTAVLNDEERKRFKDLQGQPGMDGIVPLTSSVGGYKVWHELPEPARSMVLKAFSDSARMCFIIGAAFLFSALLLTLCTKSYSLDRKKTAALTSADSGESHDCQVLDVEAQRGLPDEIVGGRMSVEEVEMRRREAVRNAEKAQPLE